MPLSQIVSASIEDGAVAPLELSSIAQYTGFKNRLINGAMVLDQRNNGAASSNAINGYFLDRWTVDQSVTGKIIAQQNAGSVTPPTGFSKYLGVTSQSAYSVGSTDYYRILQSIEGLNCADLAWGTASAATVTLSFWVRSSLTGTFGGCIGNRSGGRSYPFTYTISSANTWEQKSITIPGDTTGTYPTDNSASITIQFSLGAGATYSGTAGTWAAAGYVSATGAVSVVGTSGATFYITGVQIEKGVTATSFDYRPYGTELQLCERYYEVANNTTSYFYSFFLQTSVYRWCGTFRTKKRAAPTVTLSNANPGIYTTLSTVFSTGVDGFDSGAATACSFASYTASAEL